jgi:transcriptional regulator with XRE-family HTH domain
MGIEKTKDGILKFRNRKRLNQTELANILNIQPQNISKWESDKNNFPSFKAAEQLFLLGITVEELFGIEYEKMHGYTKSEFTSSDQDILKRLTAVEEEIKNLKNRLKVDNSTLS